MDFFRTSFNDICMMSQIAVYLHNNSVKQIYMIIGVKGFKSIKSISNYVIENVNILAGTNSSGKSSLIQSILLLKQTLESDSKEVLRLDGPYIFADSLKDLVYRKVKYIEYDIELERCEFSENQQIDTFVDDAEAKSIKIHLSFSANGTVHLQEATIILSGVEGKKASLEIRKEKNKQKDTYQITASNGEILGMYTIDEVPPLTGCELEFVNFFPTFGEYQGTEKNDKRYFSIPLMKVLKTILEKKFSDIYYIGPIRVKPALLKNYDMTPSTERVDMDGDNTRYILQEYKNKKVECGKTLAEAINEWICDKLKLADAIETSKDAKQLYRTQLKNSKGWKIDLCHMGFGISQILPILTQGLLLPKDSLFIVEDPCVHMHPYIQAAMMDFFLEISKNSECKIIVETHSDHIITRLRRRIAEGLDARKVNLRFVEQTLEGSIYQKIELTNQGAFSERLPNGFLDTHDEDFRAILSSRLKR